MFKYSVAALIKNDKEEIFVVKRSKNETEHPGYWGLPAITIKPFELPEKALERLGFEKLACKIEPVSFLGAIYQERPNYKLILLLYEAKVISGEPNVFIKNKYEDQVWTKDFNILKPIAEKGSACVQLLFYLKGLVKEENIILKLDDQLIKN